MIGRNRGILLLGFLLTAMFAAAGNYPLVAAQSCTASLGYSSLTSTQYYYGSNVGIIVPVSTSCSYVGGPLYASGDAFDTSANVDFGSVNTMLNSVYGASTFNGQLLFSLPPSILGHQLRITVSVYSGQNSYGNGYGPLLATTGQMVQVNLTYQNGYPNGNGPCYPNYNCYGNNYGNNCYGNNCYGNCYQTSYCYPGMTYCNYQPSYCYQSNYANCGYQSGNNYYYYYYNHYYYQTSCNEPDSHHR